MSTCDRRFIGPATIHIAAGHMHLLGASIRLELNPGTPRAQILLDIPRWDFHWQNAYTPRDCGPTKASDVVRVTCRHDVRKREGGRASDTEGAALRPLGARARPTRCASGSCRSRAGRPADPPRLADVPRADDPDLGVFVANLERELVRGHVFERVVDHPGKAAERGTSLWRVTRSVPRGGSTPTSCTRTS